MNSASNNISVYSTIKHNMGGCSSVPDVAYEGGGDDIPGYKPVNRRKKDAPPLPPNTIHFEYYIPGYKEVSSNKKPKKSTY